jgi:type II secretory pathway component PulF
MPVFILTLVLFSWPAFANKRLKKIRDRALLILPFIGSIVRNYILANFCGTLGKLLQKQVPIVKAVVMTANATRHTIYKQRVIALSVAVHRGQSLTQFLETEPVLFPPVLRQLVAVGEKTGTLGDNLIFLSHLYEQEISDVLTSLSIILEPAMMITLGGIVGFVAISIITPIYQITQNLHV